MRYEFNDVSVHFGSTEVLHNVSLSGEAGILAIIGLSGSGKSTILRTMAGLLQATTGNIFVGGKLVDDGGRSFVEPPYRNLQYMPQGESLIPTMNVIDNIRFGIGDHALGKKIFDDRVLEACESAGFESELLYRSPLELSGGQKQRVALARTLVSNAELVLFDEPLSSLDTALRDGVRHTLLQLGRKAGTSVIIVTHDKEDVLALADKVLVVDDGRIVQSGTAYEIYSNPVSRTAAELMGKMNIIPGGSDDWIQVIRPEFLEVTKTRKSRHLAEVMKVSQSGYRYKIWARLGGEFITCYSEHPCDVGENIGLRFDVTKSMYFNPWSGKRMI